MKEYKAAVATFISLETSDVITSSVIENIGLLRGFGNVDDSNKVSIDDIN